MFYAAVPSIRCPADFRIEETESLTRVVQVSGSLPVIVTHTPIIGSNSRTNTTSPFSVTWSLSGNHSDLMLGQDVPVTWKVLYVDEACSGVTGQSSVLANCSAIPTSSSCTTNVLQVSKLSSSLDYLYVV